MCTQCDAVCVAALCVCVSERESEEERMRQRERARERERDRQRERECVRERVSTEICMPGILHTNSTHVGNYTHTHTPRI